jgi:hypothetical protein
MANQPTAKLESNGGMYFEPIKPNAQAPVDTTVPPTFTDKELPPPDSERFPKGSISAVPLPTEPPLMKFPVVEPNEYKRPLFSPLKKT